MNFSWPAVTGNVNSFIVRIHAKCGNKARAWEALDEIKETSKSSYVPAMAFVIAYEGLGEHELAIKSLQQALWTERQPRVY